MAFYELRKSLVSLEGMVRRRKGGDMVIVDCAYLVRFWRVERTHEVAQVDRGRQVCTLGNELQIHHATEEYS